MFSNVVVMKRKNIDPPTLIHHVVSNLMKLLTIVSISPAASDPIADATFPKSWFLIISDWKHRSYRLTSRMSAGEIEKVAKKAVDDDSINGSVLLRSL